MVTHPFTGPDQQAIRDWLADPDGRSVLRVPVIPDAAELVADDPIPSAACWDSVIVSRGKEVLPAPHTGPGAAYYVRATAFVGAYDVIATGPTGPMRVLPHVPPASWNFYGGRA